MLDGRQMFLHILEKSTVDEQFREALLVNPKDAITREFGIVLPFSLNIEVHESDLQTVHIALPPNPMASEEQLEAISAGLCCCW